MRSSFKVQHILSPPDGESDDWFACTFFAVASLFAINCGLAIAWAQTATEMTI